MTTTKDSGSPAVKIWLPMICAGAMLIGPTGCVSMASVIKELKDDPATVGCSITTVYGSVRFVRTGLHPTNSTTTVSPDGTLTIKSN